MSRSEFIFSAVNAIASKRHEPTTEYLLAQAVQHEIERVRGERCTMFEAHPAGMIQKRKEQNASGL
jgi:hypothetical protein